MNKYTQSMDPQDAQDRNHWTGKYFPQWLDRLRGVLGKIGADIFICFLFLLLVGYIGTSLFVMYDYLTKQYGLNGKIICSFGAKERLQKRVVRIIGGLSEGTGFFISDHEVLTSFHVIADEPSPKIVLPSGSFVLPMSIIGDKDADVAVLSVKDLYPQMVLPLPEKVNVSDDEPLLATGYAMGADLVGKATTIKGNYQDLRRSRTDPVSYIQTTISLVDGMSGGPLTDLCGNVLGINTSGLAGLSLFVLGSDAHALVPKLTEQDVAKITVDPSKSPADAVTAFYTYLKARRMQDGFNLLSKEYLKRTNFTEWTNRFKDVLDVTIISSDSVEGNKDAVHVKFWTKNWVQGEAITHYYAGTWHTVKEDDLYKMQESAIAEVEDPDIMWFYE